MKDRHAYAVSKRRYTTVGTKDFTFGGQPAWEMEWETIFKGSDDSIKTAAWGHTREGSIISGERAYVVIVTQMGGLVTQRYSPDDRFFDSMKVPTTPQIPTVVEITKPEIPK